MVEKLALVSVYIVVVVVVFIRRSVQAVNINVLGDLVGVINTRSIELDIVTLHIRHAGLGDVTALIQ